MSKAPGGFPAESGYTVGFGLLAFFLLVATIAATRVPDLHRTDRSGARDDAVSEPAPAGA